MDLPSETQWLDGMAVSVVACDTAGVCIYMNERACQTFAKDGGRACWAAASSTVTAEPARSRLLDMLRTPRANSYRSRDPERRSSSIKRHSFVTASSQAWSNLLSSCQRRCRTSCASD